MTAMTMRQMSLTTAALAISMSVLVGAVSDQAAANQKPAADKTPAAEKKLAMKDLPPAVQKGVQDNLEGGTVKNLAKETEDGKTVYEVESTLNGKARDFMLDATGHLLSVEDEIAIDALPAAVKAVFEKQGTIVSAETLTKGRMVAYEGRVEKNGKKSAVGPVDANGKKVKE